MDWECDASVSRDGSGHGVSERRKNTKIDGVDVVVHLSDLDSRLECIEVNPNEREREAV